MSDKLIIEIIQSVLTLSGIIVTGYVSVQLAKVHKQINSRMSEMLDNTKALGKAEGKAQQIEDTKNKKK